MPRHSERLPLMTHSPGTSRSLLVHRYGTAGARPKAYMHASLHADEIPAMLVLHHLARRLDAAAAEGLIRGEIILVPYANPIGLAQFAAHRHQGRYEAFSGVNFNRGWPDLYEGLAEQMADHLGEDEAGNVAAIRSALGDKIEAMEAETEHDSLRVMLARLAYDADILLDIHCDDDALMHIYQLPVHWPEGQDLSAELGSRATLLAADSGGGSFDEAFSTPWTRLAEAFPQHPIPPACFSVTVELRGRPDVSDALAEQDATGIFRFLQRRNVIGGDPGPLPEPRCEATRLDATDVVSAPVAGILAYRVKPGDWVKKGDIIAEIVDPAAENPEKARHPVTTRTDGLVLSRRIHKLVTPGMSIAKVVGEEPLAERQGSPLLEAR